MTTPMPPFPLRLITAVMLLAPAAAALAQTQAATQNTAQAIAFDIQAGELRAALDHYARLTRLQVLYRVDDLQGLATRGARGLFTAEQGLSQLLAGTELQVRRDGATALVIYKPSSPGAAAGSDGAQTVAQAQAGAAAANTPPADPPDAAPALEVVTVTAQRRPEAAQTVPIALTTFSAAALDTYRISNLQDASRLTPGLLVSSFSQSNPTIAIRGANNTFSQMGVSKPVAVVIDDVFVPRNSAAAFELFDLDNLTVLKGPQGTLFGRNVTGGAVVINTRKPVFDQRTMEGQVTLGDLSLVQVNALANLPLGEERSLKLTAALKQRDGHGRDRLSGREQDDIDNRSLRGQFRLGLGSDAEALISVDYGEDRSGGRTLSSDTLGSDGDRRTSEVGVPQGFARTLWGWSARLWWDIGHGELTAITAYRHALSGEDYSSVGANYSFLTAGSQSLTRDEERVGTLSQEFRYASPRWAAGDVQAGIFLLDEDGSRRLANQGLAARTGVVASSTVADQSVRTRSYSVFADGAWHITPALDLVLGARYTYDRKIASLSRADLLRPTAGFGAQDLRASWGEWTPRAALNWRPTRDIALYASVTRGFTAGGFNTDATSLAALVQPFNPETVLNREIGLKSQWLGNRLRINLSAFNMRYRDKQEFVNNTVTGILNITNASEATIRGEEIEIAFRPIAPLGFSANYGHLDSRYDRFVVGSINYTGNPLASSPRNKASLAADLRLPMKGLGQLVGAISYGWTSDYNTGAANDPNLRIPGYGLLNMNLGLEADDRRWRVVAWVKNAANRDFILTRSTQVVRAEYLGEPRTYGVTSSIRF